MPRRFLSRSSIGKLDIRVRRRFGRDANSAETESIRMKIAPPYTPNSRPATIKASGKEQASCWWCKI